MSSASPGGSERVELGTFWSHPAANSVVTQQEPEICAFKLKGAYDGCEIKHEKHCIGILGEGFSFIFQLLCVDGRVKNASSTNICLWQDGVLMNI